MKIDGTESSGSEISKNAQFRAICPSPSILSFVEDNVITHLTYMSTATLTVSFSTVNCMIFFQKSLFSY